MINNIQNGEMVKELEQENMETGIMEFVFLYYEKLYKIII
jgi:hypothetical protein